MIISYLLSGDFKTALINLFVLMFVVLFINPIHEYAHAFAAYKLGDNTAKNEGRLTLNPLASFDLFGTLMFLLVGIGWAKPVPINPRNFKNQRSGTVITAAAGPISNLLFAFISCLVVAAITKFAPATDAIEYVRSAFLVLATINIMLAVFNLIPLPPLDGSRIAAGVLPDKIYFKIFKYDKYIRNGLMAFMLLAMILNRFNIDLFLPIRFVENLVLKGFLALSFIIFGIH